MEENKWYTVERKKKSRPLPQCDAAMRCSIQGSHTVLRSCHFGTRCNRVNDPYHAARFTHRLFKYTEVIYFRNIGKVIGCGGVHLKAIQKITGAVCDHDKAKASISVKADSQKQVHQALDFLSRISALVSILDWKISLAFCYWPHKTYPIVYAREWTPTL